MSHLKIRFTYLPFFFLVRYVCVRSIFWEQKYFQYAMQARDIAYIYIYSRRDSDEVWNFYWPSSASLEFRFIFYHKNIVYLY